jgi:hypothetical protein
MRYADQEKVKKDSSDTRSGTDRRTFDYTACIPERRTGKDRSTECREIPGTQS